MVEERNDTTEGSCNHIVSKHTLCVGKKVVKNKSQRLANEEKIIKRRTQNYDTKIFRSTKSIPEE